LARRGAAKRLGAVVQAQRTADRGVDLKDAIVHTACDAPRCASGEAAEVVVRLTYQPPYDWDHVHDFLATRAIPNVERTDEGGYARTVAAPGGHASICVRPIDHEPALQLRVRGAASTDLLHISAVARRVFDLACDPQRVAAALAADERLAALVRRRPGLRIPGAWDPFECAVRAVLGQQVSVAAARTLTARVVARAGERLDEPLDGLTHVFPTPAALASVDLDGLGITSARIAALRSLARAVQEGLVDFSESVAEFVRKLVALPGFGAWTAQYVALRALGDSDAFPAGDLVLRRMAGDGDVLTSRQLEARADAWRPWRGYAAMHLWREAARLTAESQVARSNRRRTQQDAD
jgi:AraC family transcriptional regulator of adaptative response / DNA-3-methyladenine glycosylase II